MEAPASRLPATYNGRSATRSIESQQLGEDDILYDLGCGDGRVLVEAVKATGARGVG